MRAARRRRPRRLDASGTMDSLTDTVTNSLGVVIIMILVAGARAQGGDPLPTPDPVVHAEIVSALERLDSQIERVVEPEEVTDRELLELLHTYEAELLRSQGLAQLHDEAERDEEDASKSRRDVEVEIERVEGELAEPFDVERRARLLALVRDLEPQVPLATKPDGKEDDELIALFEDYRALLESREKLASDQSRLTEREVAAAERAASADAAMEMAERERAEPRRTLSVNAPIVQSFEGREKHYFIVKDDRVSTYPHGRLEEKMAERIRREMRKHRSKTVSGTVGPIAGWKGRYEARIVNYGSLTRLESWTLTFEWPRGTWGEPTTSCLEPETEFHAQIEKLDPQTVVLNFVLYDDSFSRFSEIESALVARGYAVGVHFMSGEDKLAAGSSGRAIDAR